MAKNNVSEYDVVAANNTDISSNNITGTGLVSTADDSFRANSANLAKWWDDLGGVNTVAGTADAITVTTPTVYTALKTGIRFNFKASGANTTAVTLNFDAIGAKAVRKISGGVDVALVAGDIPGANARIDVIYDAAANAAAGGWILLSASVAAASTTSSGIVELLTNTEAVTGTDTTRAATANNLSAVRARRNRLVNPAMQISSVNGNTSGTANGYVPADNWATFRVTSAGTITTQRVQSVTPKGAKDRIRVTITVQDASLAAGEFLTITQAIIGQEIADFQYGGGSAKQTVLRFLFKGPAGTYAVALHNAANDRSYVALFTPAVANTDEIISLVILGDATGTWTTAATTGLTLDIVLACGSTFQGTTGWQAGNILGTSGVSNGLLNAAAVFEVGEAGLYLDPESTGVAPAWELPSYAADQYFAAWRLRAAVAYNAVANTISGSFNISSITDNATGDFTFNFTQSLPDANYVPVGGSSAQYGSRLAGPMTLYVDGGVTEVAPTASAFRASFTESNGTRFDPKYLVVSVFR